MSRDGFFHRGCRPVGRPIFGLTAGIAAGIFLGGAGSLLNAIAGPHDWRVAATTLLVACLSAAGLADIGVLPFGFGRKRNRQTPRNWQCVLGVPGATFAWGADLALAVTTRISYQALLVVPIAALLAPDFGASIGVMATFGLTRALIAVIASLTADDIERRTTAYDAWYTAFSRVAGVGSLVGAAVLAALAFGG